MDPQDTASIVSADSERTNRHPSPNSDLLDGDAQRTAYLTACERAGVSPISRILNHLTDPQLALRYYGIGPHGVGPLAEVLPINRSWRILSLADNRLQEEGACRLSKGLALHPKLTDIDLAGNRIGAIGVGDVLRELAGGDAAARLRHLRLGRNRIGDGAVRELSDLMVRNAAA